MILTPDAVNKTLIKVFYHDSSAGVWFSSNELLYAKSQYKLNLIGNITDKYKIKGFFEFILDYGSTQVSWKQQKNIKDTTSSETSSSIGYVGNAGSYFSGMARSDYPNLALYDGVFTTGYYWFCLGALQNAYNDNTFPGLYFSSTSYQLVKKVTLWMRVNPELIAKTCVKRVRSYNILLCFVVHLIASN